jgi:hypothetical protein
MKICVESSKKVIDIPEIAKPRSVMKINAYHGNEIGVNENGNRLVSGDTDQLPGFPIIDCEQGNQLQKKCSESNMGIALFPENISLISVQHLWWF